MSAFKPFSDNIIFWDTEFSSLDPSKGEILSIGMVKLNGEELYLELEHDGEVSDWVKENVSEHLKGPRISREEARERIREFVGSTKPYLVAYVNQFDVIYLYKLFGLARTTENLPFYWIPIDFASMLFVLGIDPEKYSIEEKDNLFEQLGIDASKYRHHHALDDAKLLYEVYLKLLI